MNNAQRDGDEYKNGNFHVLMIDREKDAYTDLHQYHQLSRTISQVNDDRLREQR